MTTEPPDTSIPAAPERPWWKLLLEYGLTFLVVGLVFGFVIPKLADYDKVLAIVGHISTVEWVVLAGLAGFFLVGYMLVLMSTMPSLRFREAFVVQSTATAINNSIPAGGAFSLPIQFAMYLSWGFTPEAVTAGFVAAGVFDQMARLALPVLAVAAIAVLGEASGWMWLAALGGIAIVVGLSIVLVLLFRSADFARRIGAFLERPANAVLRRFGKEPVDGVGMVLRFRADAIGIVRNRWPRVLAATMANNLAMVALFLGSVRVAGVAETDISWPWVVLAFALGRLLVMIPVSPGGLGLVDLGYIGLLTLGWQTSNPGVPPDADLIAAGVLLFRALSYLPPIPAGLGSWLFWRFNRSWRSDWKVAARGQVPTGP